MAINRSTRYPGRFVAPDANNKQGAFKNRTAPGSLDGSYLEEDWANDSDALRQSILTAAGTVIDGNVDAVGANQAYRALIELIAGKAQLYADTGAANVYVIDALPGREGFSALFDGLTVSFRPSIENTGEATVDVDGLGVKSVVNSSGSTLLGGELSGIVSITYDITSDRFFIVGDADSKSMVSQTVIEVSGTYIPPAGVKALEFIVVGAGGGSGDADGAGAGTAAASPGAGAGGTVIKVTSVIEAPYTVVIGAGGPGGVGGAGGDGGDTTVVGGLLSLTADGGFGSNPSVGSAGNLISAGAAGGSATGGDINLKGGAGSCAVVVNGEIATLGQGGGSYFGGEEAGRFNSDGSAATTYGAGGPGVSSLNTTTNRPGSDGADGVVIVKEYF